MKSIFAMLFLSAALLAHAADPALLNAAKAAQPAVIESLRAMVAIESGSANVAGLTRMADLLEARLKALGAQTERIKVTRGPGAFMVKATLTGSGRKRLLMIGHMDTVYPEGILASQGYRMDGNKLYGPGIADDKGGLAVILHSLEILKAAGWRDYAQLTVLINPDEEIGSVGPGGLIPKPAPGRDRGPSCRPAPAETVAKGTRF